VLTEQHIPSQHPAWDQSFSLCPSSLPTYLSYSQSFLLAGAGSWTAARSQLHTPAPPHELDRQHTTHSMASEKKELPQRERRPSVGAPIVDIQGSVGPAGISRPKHKRTLTGFGASEIKTVEGEFWPFFFLVCFAVVPLSSGDRSDGGVGGGACSCSWMEQERGSSPKLPHLPTGPAPNCPSPPKSGAGWRHHHPLTLTHPRRSTRTPTQINTHTHTDQHAHTHQFPIDLKNYTR